MERAAAIQIPGVRWSAGAPEPVVFSTESRTVVAFYADVRDVVDADEVLTAELVGCISITFGFPNDEALAGHRLWGHGLEHYGLHEVIDSAWIDELNAVEAVHPRAVQFTEARHFLLAFHDSTLETIAKDIRPMNRYPTMAAAIEAMTSS